MQLYRARSSAYGAPLIAALRCRAHEHAEPTLQARQRTEGRSGTEFGATLQAIRRLTPLGSEKAKKSNTERVLHKSLLREFKREVKRLPPRTLANSLYVVAELHIADKVLMSKAVQGVSRWCATARERALSCFARQSCMCSTVCLVFQRNTKAS